MNKLLIYALTSPASCFWMNQFLHENLKNIKLNGTVYILMYGSTFLKGRIKTMPLFICVQNQTKADHS